MRISSKYGATKSLSISDFVTVSRKNELERIAFQLETAEIPNFVFGDLPIARLTSFEPLIKYKKRVIDGSVKVTDHWRQTIFQGLVTLEATNKILDLVNPNVALIYSPQYAAGSVFAEICRRRDIPVIFSEGSFHVGEKYTSIHAWNWDTHGLVDPAINTYRPYQLDAIDDPSRRRIERHLRLTQQSKSFASYSSGKKRKSDIRREFKIPSNSKVILCALSSHDEISSGVYLGKIPEEMRDGSVFLDQFEWIDHTIKFAARHLELFFIIRLHPRLQSNKRESVTSDELREWTDLFLCLPSNVVVDYPSEQRSISNYFEQIDLLITGWSSTAIDALAQGVPAISYDKNVSWFPRTTVFAADTVASYEQAILNCVKTGRTQENIDKAFGWLYHRIIRGVIRVPGRLIDQLRLSNLTLAEKSYSGLVKFCLPVLAHVEFLLSKNQRSTDQRALNDLLEDRATNLFGTTGFEPQ